MTSLLDWCRQLWQSKPTWYFKTSEIKGLSIKNQRNSFCICYRIILRMPRLMQVTVSPLPLYFLSSVLYCEIVHKSSCFTIETDMQKPLNCIKTILNNRNDHLVTLVRAFYHFYNIR